MELTVLFGEGTKLVGMNDWAFVLMKGLLTFSVLTETSDALILLSSSGESFCSLFSSKSVSEASTLSPSCCYLVTSSDVSYTT